MIIKYIISLRLEETIGRKAYLTKTIKSNIIYVK